jgi:hypothetical protein
MKKQLKKLADTNKNTIAKVLFYFLLLSCINFAQESETTMETKKDSVYRYRGIIPPVEFKYDLKQIFKEPVAQKIPTDILYSDDPSTIWLRTEMMISNHSFLSEGNQFDPHFTSHLYRQYLKDSEFDMVRYVLGMAQLSAVTYMAYRHIKKYGFLK